MDSLKAANPLAVTERVVGLAGAAVGVAGTVAREAVHVPVSVTRSAVRVADAAVGLAGTVARETAHVLRSNPGARDAAPSLETGSVTATDSTRPAAPAADTVSDVAGAPPGPTVVAVEPHAPEQPPVDVVGETLAAEAMEERGEWRQGGGMAHEPRGASRDEEHGDSALQRAEAAEIAEEARAAMEGDVEPEEPLTEPLLDPADAAAVAAELATMSRAADPDKG